MFFFTTKLRVVCYKTQKLADVGNILGENLKHIKIYFMPNFRPIEPFSAIYEADSTKKILKIIKMFWQSHVWPVQNTPKNILQSSASTYFICNLFFVFSRKFEVFTLFTKSPLVQEGADGG